MSSERSRGRMLVISGPSGCGKSTICKRLLEDPRVEFSVSATTRTPRAGEVDGRDYHFLSREVFEKKVDAGEFIEWAEVHGNLYGTLRAPLDRALAEGRFVLLEVDVQGGAKLKSLGIPGLYVFIAPPDMETLRRRLEGRGTDTPAVIDHFARIGVDGQIRDADLAALCKLARHKKTYVKVSAFYALGQKKPPYLDLIPMIKRVYEARERGDGERILVDRLWPRGLSKQAAAMDEWRKDLGPSHELRKWFGHDPTRWREFRRRYLMELDPHGLVEGAEETRAVLATEGCIVALAFSGFTQVLLEIAHGHGHADGLRREGTASRTEYMGAQFDRACRKRDIGGDDDVVRSRCLDDPVVGGVGALGHHDVADHRIA